MSGFDTALILGGELDKLKALPHPLFASVYTPLAIGKQLPIPATVGQFEDSYALPVYTEVTAISVWNSQWAVGDYWDLWLGNIHVCQKIYTKTIPQTIPMGHISGLIYPLAANSNIRFRFTNGSGITKTVDWDIKFLYDQPVSATPVLP